MYIISFYGDLPKLREECKDRKWFETLDDALEWVKDNFGTPEKFPDPEDDKIIIEQPVNSLEYSVGDMKIVWGFYGWHWPNDADKHEQGILPGDDKSLYSRAMEDY